MTLLPVGDTNPEKFTVFVPTEGSDLRSTVIRGSGMVGSEIGKSGRIRVDFEGNGDVFPTFVARVRRAAERHGWTGSGDQQGYPTRACAYVSPDELIAVGIYDARVRRVTVTRPGVLRRWLDVESLDPREIAVE